MVFRGKPSKACARCRQRRLKCDFKKPHCSSCIRVGKQCAGYRDTNSLRITDQTEFVTSKVLDQNGNTKSQHIDVPIKLHHLPQDIQVLGREIFYAYYVTDFSRTWDFLFSYQDRHTTPEHVNLGIDAVSLAFLSHQVASQTAAELGRRKYGEALRKISKVVQDPNTASDRSTFDGALLLDLFEKLTRSTSEINAARHAHVEGALALVSFRGVENFHNGPELRALLGLSLNATICSLSIGKPIPNIVHEIRRYAAQYVDCSYPKWRLSNVILEVPDLAANNTKTNESTESNILRSIELDTKLAIISREASPAWSYKRTFASAHDPRISVPNGFFPVYDIYPNRTITQMWNVLRITRILLCEGILASCDKLDTPTAESQAAKATQTITEQIREICASCPQMTNCTFAARHKLPNGAIPGRPHVHTMPHILDVYILIFALYVVAWARHCPEKAREWAVSQLEHIAEHFGIREAGTVLAILRAREVGVEDPAQEPWYVYGLLGYMGLCSIANT